jgi:ribonuclease HI
MMQDSQRPYHVRHSVKPLLNMLSVKMQHNQEFSRGFKPSLMGHQQMTRQLLYGALTSSRIKHVPFRLGGLTLFAPLGTELQGQPSHFGLNQENDLDLLDDDEQEHELIAVSMLPEDHKQYQEPRTPIRPQKRQSENDGWDRAAVISFLNSCVPETSTPGGVSLQADSVDDEMPTPRSSGIRSSVSSKWISNPRFSLVSEEAATTMFDSEIDPFGESASSSDEVELISLVPPQTASFYESPELESKLPSLTITQEKIEPAFTTLPKLRVGRWMCKEDAIDMARRSVRDAEKDPGSHVVLFVDGSFRQNAKEGWSCWGAAVVRKSPALPEWSLSGSPLPTASRTWGYKQVSGLGESVLACGDNNDAESLAITLGIKGAIEVVKRIMEGRRAGLLKTPANWKEQVPAKRILVQVFTDSIISLNRIDAAIRGQYVNDKSIIIYDFTEFCRATNELYGLGSDEYGQVAIELHWVPGHSGVPGNEEADRLAMMQKTKLIEEIHKALDKKKENTQIEELPEEAKGLNVEEKQPELKATLSKMEVVKTTDVKEKPLTSNQIKMKPKNGQQGISKEERKRRKIAENERLRVLREQKKQLKLLAEQMREVQEERQKYKKQKDDAQQTISKNEQNRRNREAKERLRVLENERLRVLNQHKKQNEQMRLQEQKRREEAEKRRNAMTAEERKREALQEQKKKAMAEERRKLKALKKQQRKAKIFEEQAAESQLGMVTRSMARREEERKTVESGLEQSISVPKMNKRTGVHRFQKRTNKARCILQMIMFLVLTILMQVLKKNEILYS